MCKTKKATESAVAALKAANCKSTAKLPNVTIASGNGNNVRSPLPVALSEHPDLCAHIPVGADCGDAGRCDRGLGR